MEWPVALCSPSIRMICRILTSKNEKCWLRPDKAELEGLEEMHPSGMFLTEKTEPEYAFSVLVNCFLNSRCFVFLALFQESALSLWSCSSFPEGLFQSVSAGCTATSAKRL